MGKKSVDIDELIVNAYSRLAYSVLRSELEELLWWYKKKFSKGRGPRRQIATIAFAFYKFQQERKEEFYYNFGELLEFTKIVEDNEFIAGGNNIKDEKGRIEKYINKNLKEYYQSEKAQDIAYKLLSIEYVKGRGFRVKFAVNPENLKAKEPSSFIALPPTPYIHQSATFSLHKNFVGRKFDRELLNKWLYNDERPMLVLHAMGGMGKSSHVVYWLEKEVIPSDNKLDGIIWWPFYDADASFEAFIDVALEYTTFGKINPAGIKYITEKMKIVYQQLRLYKFLIIFDGFERLLRYYARMDASYIKEPVPEVYKNEEQAFRLFVDYRVSNFIKSLATPQVNSKFLITSRLVPLELEEVQGCKTVELKGFSLDEAHKFFHLQGVEWIRTEVENVCKPYGFLPLALRLLTFIFSKPMSSNFDATEYKSIIHKLTRELRPSTKHVFEVAYNCLTKEEQELLTRMSAHRSYMDINTIYTLCDDKDRKAVYKMLSTLIDIGMVLFNKEKSYYDLHPSIRAYCYEYLKAKRTTHIKLMNYYKSMTKPDRINSLEDLHPFVELFYHTLRAGFSKEALNIFDTHIHDHIYYEMGAYQYCIELLSEFFPEGLDKVPKIKDRASQARILNVMSLCYNITGSPATALSLRKKQIEIRKKLRNIKDIATSTLNLSYIQINLGDLKGAKDSLNYCIRLSTKLKHKYFIASVNRTLGLVLAYEGKWKEAERLFNETLKESKKEGNKQKTGIITAFKCRASLLKEDYPKALKLAEQAMSLAHVKSVERDIITAKWLLGVSNRGIYETKNKDQKYLQEAEEYVVDALQQCRQVYLTVLEAEILLEFARIKFLQRCEAEAEKLSNDALKIADRCHYRLQQADIHLFRAQLALDSGDKTTALHEVELAIERASCGYKPVLEKAKRLKELILSR